jgi:hypothetical protein
MMIRRRVPCVSASGGVSSKCELAGCVFGAEQMQNHVVVVDFSLDTLWAGLICPASILE